MKTLRFDQLSGGLVYGGVRLSPQYSYQQFTEGLVTESNLIMGKDGDASYALRETVWIFGQEFRVQLRFSQKKLAACTLLLLSGPVQGLVAEYPDDLELRREFDFLLRTHIKELQGHHELRAPLSHFWGYSWGSVYLLLQPQGACVLTEISWS